MKRNPSVFSFTCLTSAAALAALCALAHAGEPYLVKDINPTGPSMPVSLRLMGNKVFFNATDGVNGQELWVSNGTEQGTYMVKDIVPGADGCEPVVERSVNGKMFFQANGDNVDGLDLWASDGSWAGTYRIKDTTPGEQNLPPGICGYGWLETASLNGFFLYVADYPALGYELWKSDGTVNGTTYVKNIRPGSEGGNPGYLTNVGSVLVFSANDGSGYGVWRTDGTSGGTYKLSDTTPYDIVAVNGMAFFSAGYLPEQGGELWITDPTGLNPHMVKDINPGPNPSTPNWMTELNGFLIFNAYEPNTGRELWISDGTEQGTVLLLDRNPGPAHGGGENLTNVNGSLFFSTYDPIEGSALWTSDGTAVGTVKVTVLGPPSASHNEVPGFFTPVNGKLYFRNDDGIHGIELWVSDGTAVGTYMVADINPDSEFGCCDEIKNGNGVLFLVASDGVTASELWALDTTEIQIPTVSPRGLVLMALLLGGAGLLVMRRRRCYRRTF